MFSACDIDCAKYFFGVVSDDDTKEANQFTWIACSDCFTTSRAMGHFEMQNDVLTTRLK